MEQYFFRSISFLLYFIFYASIVNVYHLIRRKNEWVKIQKKKALLHWNPVFSGSEAYMLVLDTFLFIYLFSSRGSGQITEQDRVREIEKNFKLTRKHRQTYTIRVIHCAIRQFKCFFSDSPRVVL